MVRTVDEEYPGPMAMNFKTTLEVSVSGPGNTQDDTSIKILTQLAAVRGDRAELKQAQRDMDDAMKLALARDPGRHHAATVEAEIGTGKIHLLAGEYGKAIDILTPFAQTTNGKVPLSPYDVRDSTSMLSEALLFTNQYDLAEASSRRAIALDKQLFGDSHPQTGGDIMNLAAILASQGRFSEAEQLYRQGIETIKNWYGPDHPDVITAFSILARVLISERKDAEAEAILNQVLQSEERIYPEVHERVAFTLGALAQLSVQRGNYSQGETYQKRTVAIYQALYGENNPKTAGARSNLGAIYLKKAKYPQAEETLRQAVRTYETLPPGSNFVGLTRGRWGRALLMLKHYPEAERELNAADGLLSKMAHPPAGEVSNVRSDLVSLNMYRSIHKSGKAANTTDPGSSAHRLRAQLQ